MLMFRATEEQFDIEIEGWDLMEVFDEISETLDRVFRDYSMNQESYQKRRNGLDTLYG